MSRLQRGHPRGSGTIDTTREALLGRIDALRALRPELEHCYAAMAADDAPEHVSLHSAAVALFERIDRLEAGPHRATWRRLAGILATFPHAPDCSFRAAVLTNMMGVVALGDAEDYAYAAALARRFGRRQVVHVQNELDDLLGLGPGLPMTTAFVRELARRGHIARVLERAGHDRDEAVAIAEKCHGQAFWLILADVDTSVLRPVPRRPEEMVHLMEEEGVDEWRKVVAVVAASPWGPEVSRLVDLARAADLESPAHALEQVANVYRRRFEEAERLEVAKEIRRLVAISGCSQRQFAQHVGTSPSRLSTYVNGLVTPSAAMMLRIGRAATALAGEREAQATGGLHT